MKAQLLMILYSIRSNRQLVEQIHYNFLFRWFLGMGLDEKVWDHSSFTKNSDRLIGSEVAAEFLSRVLAQAEDYARRCTEESRRSPCNLICTLRPTTWFG